MNDPLASRCTVIGVYFSFFELLHLIMKIRSQLIKARPSFYVISENTTGVFELLTVRFTHHVLLSGMLLTKKMDMLACTPLEFIYFEDSPNTFVFVFRQNQLLYFLTTLQFVGLLVK